MWTIRRKLYLGDIYTARDRHWLEQIGITHILNCAEEVPCFHRGQFRYCHLKLTDPDPEFHEYIEKLCRFIRRGRRAGGVLVHCRAGLSRSPSAILAYLCSRGHTLEQALEILRRGVGETRTGFIEPDASFLEQIELHFADE
jgi:protein-tyrosine phosphatase